MEIARLLPVSRVADSEARSKKRALELLAESLASATTDLGQHSVFASLIGRERLGSTGIGHGVALPHGRVEGIDTCLGAFIRLREPIDFEAADGEPVDLLFGLLVPTACGDEHLAALSAIATRFGDEAVREAVRKAPDAATVHRLLTAGSD